VCVQVKLEERSEGAPAAGKASHLSFVDLAGSERLGRTGNTGNRLKCVRVMLPAAFSV